MKVSNKGCKNNTTHACTKLTKISYHKTIFQPRPVNCGVFNIGKKWVELTDENGGKYKLG